SADGASPDRRQSPEHGFGIKQSGHRANDAPHSRQRGSLPQEEPAHTFRRKTERQQDADFRHALLEPELKEQRHEQQRRDDQEEAEPKKQLTKILRLSDPFERLLMHWLEPQPDGLRLEGCQQIGLESPPEFAGGHVRPVRVTKRGQVSEAVSPHLL